MRVVILPYCKVAYDPACSLKVTQACWRSPVNALTIGRGEEWGAEEWLLCVLQQCIAERKTCCRCSLFSQTWWCTPAAVIHTELSPSITQCVCHYDRLDVCLWRGVCLCLCVSSFLVFSSILMSPHDNWATVQHLVVLSRGTEVKLLAPGENDMIGWPLFVQITLLKRSLTAQSRSLSPTISTSIQSLHSVLRCHYLLQRWEIMLDIIVGWHL